MISAGPGQAALPQDFAGAEGISIVNYCMTKHALAFLLGFFSFAIPLIAQTDLSTADLQTITSDQLRATGEVDDFPALTLARPDLFSVTNGSLLLHGLPVLTLLDGRRFPIDQDSGRFGASPIAFIPVGLLRAVTVENSPSPLYGTDAPGGVVDLHLNRNYSGGEAGVYFGSSGGKYGRQDFDSYISAGVGTDAFQINAGAVYENTRLHLNH